MTEPQHLPRTVLVVEDHAFQRRTLVRVLESMGVARVIEAEDGSQALALLAGTTHSVEMVFTDLDMPTMDGMALMRQIGQHAPAARLVVLSAVAPDLLAAVQWLAREQHINLVAVLGKPASAKAIEAALRRSGRPRPATGRAVPAFTLDQIGAALSAGQFEAFIQPKVHLGDGQFAGGEALARWSHPQLGWVAPAAFIESIESSALIEPFSLAMLESAAQAVRWLEQSVLPGRIAINASPAWLDQPTMAERLTQAVTRLGLPIERLIIEVTESVANGNLAAALENLARLRMRGFKLSVDDFGTGFSSLQRLMSSPFSELKLDRSFISGVERNSPRWHVVESTIALARKLGLETVAEGIETESEWQLLKDAGCDAAQGYFIAKPMCQADFQRWSQARANVPVSGAVALSH